jgi:hypothetical protein
LKLRAALLTASLLVRRLDRWEGGAYR